MPAGDREHVCRSQEGRIERTPGPHQDLRGRQGNFTEAAFIIKGQPPYRICVPTQEFDSWFEQARWTRMLRPWRAGGLAHRMRCRATGALTVYVPGTVAWTDSSIDVVTGDTLEIKAGGRIQHSENGPLLTPTVIPTLWGTIQSARGRGCQSRRPDRKTGKDGVPFVVGSKFEMAVESEGRLYLGINDSGVETTTASSWRP